MKTTRVFLSIVLIALAQQAWSATSWNGTIGDWHTPGNWTGGVPTDTNTETAYIANDGTVNLATDAQSYQIILGNGTLNLSGSANLSSVQTGTSNQSVLGNVSDTRATLTMSDNAHWDITAGLHVGRAGDANLTMDGDSSLKTNFLVTAFADTGTANITLNDRATLTVETQLQVGRNNTATLTLNNNALVTATTLTIGNQSTGNGTLIMNGGSIETTTLRRLNGTANVTVSGGTLRATGVNATYAFLDNLGNLSIGTGGLTIDSNGYDISTNATNLDGGTDGNFTKDGDGTLTLEGGTHSINHTAINNGTLAFANATASMQSAHGGGTVVQSGTPPMVTGSVTRGDILLANSTLNISGALDITGNLSLDSASSASINNATLGGIIYQTSSAPPGNSVSSGHINLDDNSTLTINSTLDIKSGSLSIKDHSSASINNATLGGVIYQSSVSGNSVSSGNITLDNHSTLTVNNTLDIKSGNLSIKDHSTASMDNATLGGQIYTPGGSMIGPTISSGTINLEGNSTLSVNSTLSIKRGTLDIKDRSAASMDNATLGGQSYSSGMGTTVSSGTINLDTNSTLTVNSTLDIKSGNLSIKDHSSASMDNASIGGQSYTGAGGPSVSSGTITLDTNSTLTVNSALDIKRGTLSIKDHSAASMDNASIGGQTYSSGMGTTVSSGTINLDANSTLTVNSTLDIKSGNLSINNHSAASMDNATIGGKTYSNGMGGSAISSGTINLEGNSTLSVNNTLDIKSGNLSIKDHAIASMDNATLGGQTYNSTPVSPAITSGTINLDTNSTLTVNNTLTVKHGSLQLADNSLVTASSISLGHNNGTLIGTGSILMNGGLIETTSISKGDGNASVTVSGGTLRATGINATHAFLDNLGTLSIDTGGLTIDSNGYDISTRNTSLQSYTGNFTKEGQGNLTLADGTHRAGYVYINNGTLALNGSATYNSWGSTSIAGKTSSVATLALSGNAFWESRASFYVGDYGVGTLSLTDNARLYSGDEVQARIGANTGSIGSAILSLNASWTVNGTLSVGYLGIGSISLSDNARLTYESGSLYIGRQAGSSGSISLSDNAALSNEGYDPRTAYIGYEGNGSLTVKDNAKVSPHAISLGDQATGNGSILLNGGVIETANITKGAGNATVSADGGTLRATAAGIFLSDLGEISLTGDGLTIDSNGRGISTRNTTLNGGTTSNFTKEGQGNLTITDGTHTANRIYANNGTLSLNGSASLSAHQGLVGSGIGTDGTLTLSDNASWTNTGALYVGFNHGTGNLHLSDNASVSANLLIHISYNTNLDASITLSDNASLSGHNGLYVGENGNGTLDISGNARVSAPTILLGVVSGSNGTLNLNGGIIETANITKGNGNATFTANGGTLRSTADGTFLDKLGAINIGTNGLTIDSNGHDISTNATNLQGGTNGNLTKDGLGNLTLEGGDHSANRTYVNNGTLALTNNTSLSDAYGYIGNGTGTNGNLTLSDNATWANSGRLYVGEESGTGSLLISDNASLSSDRAYIGSSNGRGNASLSGNASWTTGYLHVGDDGYGSLFISDNASVSSTNTYIGEEGRTGNASLSGNASWTTGYLRVGYESGTGSLFISDYAKVSSSSATLGMYGGRGNTTLSGNAMWTNNGSLNVGYEGTGTLFISDYAKLSSGSATIGNDGTGSLFISDYAKVSSSSATLGIDGGRGNATLSGNAMWTNNGSLTVGSDGTGSLFINEYAELSSATAIIGHDYGTGNVSVSGNASWTNNGSLTIGDDGTGSLFISDYAKVSSATAIIGDDYGKGDLNISGNALVTASRIILANSTNTQGNLTLNDGVIETASISKGDGNASVSADGGTLRATAAGVFLDNLGEISLTGHGLTIDSNGYDISTRNTSLNGGSVGNFTKEGLGSLTLNGGIHTSNKAYINNGTLSLIENASFSSSLETYIAEQAGSTANVILADNSSIYSGWDLYIANRTGSSANITLSNNSSIHSDATIYIARQGNATIFADNSSIRSSHDLNIASESGSSANITLSNNASISSRWDASINIAYAGNVSISADNSSIYSDSNLNIASGSGSSANITLSNNSSITAATLVYITNQTGSSANISLSSNSSISSGSELYIANGGNVSIFADNSSISAQDILFIAYNGRASISADNSTISAGYLYIGLDGNASVLANNSAISANGIVIASDPGSVGNLSIHDSLVETHIIRGGRGNATFSIDGGTLRRTDNTRPSDYFLEDLGVVTVGSKGLTIDSNGYDISTRNTSLNGGTTGNFTKEGLGSLTLTDSAHTANYVYANNGTLALSNNASLSNTNGYIGNGTDANGTVTLSDNATWINSGSLHIGYNNGTANLHLSDKAHVSADSLIQIAYNSGYDAAVTLSGDAYLWGFSDLYVGQNGNGTLDISGHARVSNAGGGIGVNTGSHSSVNLSDHATWENNGNLTIGNLGNGNLTLTDNSHVSARNIFVGYASGSHGTLSILDDSLVSAQNIVMGHASGSNSTITLNGGGIETASITKGAGSVSFTVNGGILRSTADGSILQLDDSDITLGDRGLTFDTQRFTTNLVNSFSNTNATISKAGSGTLYLDNENALANVAGLHIDNGTVSSSQNQTIRNLSSYNLTDTTTHINLGITRNLTVNSGNYHGTLTAGNLIKEGLSNETYTVHQIGALGGLDTFINNGTLQLRDIDGYNGSYTYNLTLADGSVLDLSDTTWTGSEENANDWSGLNIINNGGTIIGSNDFIRIVTPGLYNGTLSGGIYVIVDVGAGNSTTLGNLSDYQGNTRIESGTLNLSNITQVGNASYAREVILDGGHLRVTETVDASDRSLELRQNGTLTVDTLGHTNTWNAIVNGNASASELILTRNGMGILNVNESVENIGLNLQGGMSNFHGGGNLSSLTVGETAIGSTFYGNSTVINSDAFIDSGTSFNSNHTLIQGNLIGGSNSTLYIVSKQSSYIDGNSTLNGTTIFDADGTHTLNGTVTINGNTSLLNSTKVIANNVTHIGYAAGSNASLTLSDNSSWTSNGTLIVGEYGTATLTLSGNASVSNDFGLIGYNSNSTVSLSDYASWTNNGDLDVGRYGNATLTLSGNASVSNNSGYIAYESSSNSSVSLSDNASWTNNGTLDVGRNGTATLTLSGNASVSSYGGIIGNNSSSNGSVSLSDNASWTNNSNLLIGRYGNATLTASGNASVSNNDGYIGSESSPNATVSLSDYASWTNNGILNVGLYGNATLTLSGNAALSNTAGTIGYQSSSNGNVSLSDNASWTNNGTIDVGRNGNATLTLSGNAALSASNLILGLRATASGTLTMNGGTITTASITAGEGSALLTSNGGTLRATADGIFLDNLGSIGGTGLTIDSAGHDISTRNTDIQLSGNFTKDGLGTLTLADGDHGAEYVFVNNGTLALNNHASFYPGGDTTIAQNAGSTANLTLANNATWLADGNLLVGDAGNATLTLSDNSYLLNYNGYVGNSALSTGSVELSGHAIWENNQVLYIGNAGNATLSAGDYSSVNAANIQLAEQAGSEAQVTLTGNAELNASNYLTVGQYGNATLTANGHSAIASANSGHIGFQSGANGSVSLSQNATWDIGVYGLSIGFNGTGKLELADDAILSNNGHVEMANALGSEATAIVSGNAQWINADYLSVGDKGNATLTINGSAEVSSDRSYIAYNSGSLSSVSVSDNGSWINTGNLNIGSGGNGSLNISDNATVSAVNTSLGSNSGGTGTLTMDGGTLATANLAKGTGSASFSANGSTLRATADGSFFTNFTSSDITLGDRGLTIDTQGFTSKLAAALPANANATLTKTGSGTLNATVANALAGTHLHLDNGTLSSALDQSILNLTSNAAATNSTLINLGTTANLTVNSGDYHGSITAGNLIKEGSASDELILHRIEGLAENTLVNNGTLSLRDIPGYNGSSPLYTLTINQDGLLDLSDTDFLSGESNANHWNGLNLINHGTIIGSNDFVRITTPGTYDGTLSGGIYTVIDVGAGNAVRLGNHSDYKGYTRIESGTLQVSDNTQIGNTSLARSLILDGGGISFTADVDASQRAVELRKDGAIDVADTHTASIRTLTGNTLAPAAEQSFTKTGNGTLIVSETVSAPLHLNLAEGNTSFAADSGDHYIKSLTTGNDTHTTFGNATLRVSGNATLNGNTSFDGNTLIGGDLLSNATSSSSFNGDTTQIDGNATLNGNSSFDGHTTIQGDLLSNATSSFTGLIQIFGDATLNGNTSLDSITQINGDLLSNATSSFNGRTFIDGNTTLNGNTTFTSDTFAVNATLNGNTTFAGNASIYGGLQTSATSTTAFNGEETSLYIGLLEGTTSFSGNRLGAYALVLNGTTTIDTAESEMLFLLTTPAANTTLNGNLSVLDQATLLSDITGNGNLIIGSSAIGSADNLSQLSVNLTNAGEFHAPAQLGNVTNTGNLHLPEINNVSMALLSGNGGHIHFAQRLTRAMAGNQRLSLGSLAGSQTFHNVNVNLATGAGDHIAISGDASGNHTLNIVNTDPAGKPKVDSIHLVSITGQNNATFNGGIDSDLYHYSMVGSSKDWHLKRTGYSAAGQMAISSLASMSMGWFQQLDNLNRRIGELRLLHDIGSREPEQANGWFRAYTSRVNTNLEIAGVNDFHETFYGADAGADWAFRPGPSSTRYLGFFIGYQRSSREMKDLVGTKGNTDNIYAGLYMAYINNDGWYADANIKFQSFKNSFDSYSGTEKRDSDYNTMGAGLNIELGRQWQLDRDWFIEPSAQVSYLHLDGKTDQNAFGLMIDTKDADILQLATAIRMGRTIETASGSLLQPYYKLGFVRQSSSGGEIRISGTEWTPNTDGVRFQGSVGLIWQPSDLTQFHFDYEATWGDKYKRPYAITVGVRRKF